MATDIARLTTSLMGRYRIERELGSGGMATVYLAHDARHDRRVALKVLRSELAAVIGADRFLHEIKTTANLQHPHILALFDSGEVDGTVFYVMPLVEGESLRDRLSREKQLPVDEAVRIAKEVADALDYAHRHGVVHRDIKPENILLHDGRAVVADFGIALAVSRSDNASRMTETGMSLGTPHYMSPEQAMGEREITARSDVYALGCVLYEMLAGEPPFTGPTAQAIVARVVTESPRSLTAQRQTIPPHVDAAVRRALQKLPADRFKSAAEFGHAITTPGTLSLTEPVAAEARPAGVRRLWRNPYVAWGTAASLLAAIIALLSVGTLSGSTAATPPIRFVLNAADSTRPVDLFPWPAAISPDGRTVVYSVGVRGLNSMFYVQRTDQLEPRPIPGTAGAYMPYFSPDGEWLAFQQVGRDKKVRLDGSSPITIAEGGSANGADWTRNDEIISGATLQFAGLGRVSAAGGTMRQFTFPDTAKREKQHVWPIAVPDGRHVVFTIWYGNLESSQLAVASLDDGRVAELGVKGVRPLAILDSRVVYIQADGIIMAVALDAKNGRVVGHPVPVHDPVPVVGANNGNSGAFISTGGALVTSRGNVLSQLAWLSQDGTRHPITNDVRSYALPVLSPDERRLAVLVTENQKTDVWIYDFVTRTFSRLTTNGTVTSVQWSADGSRVMYTGRGERLRTAVFSQSASGGSAPESLLEIGDLAPVGALSADGRWSVMQTYDNNTWNLLRARLDTTPVTPSPYVSTAANEYDPSFSPDSRWVTFLSDESSRAEVYVRSFPDPTSKVQVSAEGAQEVVWADDGKRIFYRSGNSILAATVAMDPQFRVVRRDTVISADFPNVNGVFGASYDLARDGRFLTLFSSRDNFELVVSPNWITEFRERIAASEKRSRR